MKCDVAMRRLALAAGGDLPARRQRALERHLAGCEGCRRAFDELRLTVEQLRSSPPPHRPAEADAAFRHRVVAALAPSPAPAARPLRALLATVAAAAVVVVAILTLRPRHAPTTPPRPVAQRVTPMAIAAPLEEREPPAPTSPPTVEETRPQRVAAAVETRTGPPVETALLGAECGEGRQRVPIKIVTSDPSVVIYWNVPTTGGTT